MTTLTARLTSIDFNWRTLLRWAAVADLIMLLGLVVTNGDALALALAAIILLGQALIQSGAMLGTAVLAFVSAVITFYTFTGAISNIMYGEEIQVLIVPSYLATVSFALLISAIAVGLHRANPDAGRRAARIVAAGIVALFIVMLSVSLVSGPTEMQVSGPADIELVTENMAFGQIELTADAGTVTLLLANHDLFWHTFTIDELGVDVKSPVGGERQISFDAAPGTYTFYCAIPGHETLGMMGTLTIRAADEG